MSNYFKGIFLAVFVTAYTYASDTVPSFDCDFVQLTSEVLPNYHCCNVTADYSPAPSIVFIHIPKSGGSSVEHLLGSYKKKELKRSPTTLSASRSTHVDTWLKNGGDRTKHIDLFRSKHSSSVLGHTEKPVLLVAIFRHPLERILSHYKYILGTSYPAACTITTKKKRFMPFDHWYRANRGHCPDINNFEVRLFVTKAEDKAIEHTSETSILIDKRKCRWRSPLAKLKKKHLELAIARAKKLSLVALLHRFEEAMKIWNLALPGFFTEVTKKKNPVHVYCGNAGHSVCSHTNTTENSTSNVTDPVLRSFRAVESEMESDNWASMELWRVVNILYEKQLKAAGNFSR